ncbi:hypothetical protein JCM31826_10710 [Thermaurantimonas aggregans]|uniref:Uncharacterized protein n=1 Tax=Thermaurantimonas aggregans TaxID=2173829 RepID=A0A401XKP4_9FLAO|nr:hypothetical protein [Thermaurantimonas aggregans]MCX8147927.1 hypothetical protein [Thermaurantimonas aggregans]GCD77589.1 hypothetical protein JCM31826_10710 [Thermaurantimonas aggregans]
MLILGGWALGNIGLGIAGMSTTTGSTYYFHQMNTAWNVVNVGIATAGYFFTKPQISSTTGSVANSLIDLENSLMLNTGLDVAYITAGIALIELSRNTAYSSPDRFRGFGLSLILQGAFLGVFDVYQYVIFHKKRKVFIESRFTSLQIEPIFNGLAIRF